MIRRFELVVVQQTHLRCGVRAVVSTRLDDISDLSHLLSQKLVEVTVHVLILSHISTLFTRPEARTVSTTNRTHSLPSMLVTSVQTLIRLIPEAEMLAGSAARH